MFQLKRGHPPTPEFRKEIKAMPRTIGIGLSRREREVLDALHRLGSATAVEVMEAMPEPPSYSAVRSILHILEEKGHATHREEGKRYLYLAAEPRHVAAKNALNQVMHTFFAGSLESAVRTFLDDRETDVSEEELERLSQIIAEAKQSKEGRA
jgi:predicted transcriptional regulator